MAAEVLALQQGSCLLAQMELQSQGQDGRRKAVVRKWQREGLSCGSCGLPCPMDTQTSPHQSKHVPGEGRAGAAGGSELSVSGACEENRIPHLTPF